MISLSDTNKSRESILDYLYSAEISSLQCQADIMQSETGRVVYNLDYSTFFSGIWTEKAKSNLYDVVSGELYTELTSQKGTPFTPMITSATFVELMESFLGRVDRLRDSAKSINDRVETIKTKLLKLRDWPITNSHEAAIKQSEIQLQLRSLDELTGRTLAKSIRRTEALLGPQGAVVGLGDVTASRTSDIRFNKDEIDRLMDEMWTFRSLRDARQDAEEKKFRYLVDCLNIYTTRQLCQLSNHGEHRYVSRASYTSHFLPDHGRSPLVPLFWLKASRSPEFINSREIIEFFKSISSQANYVHSRFLRRTEPVGMLSDFNYGLLDSFNSTYMSQLNVFRKAELSEFDPNHDRLFTDKRFLESDLDNNLSSAQASFAKLYNEFGGILNDDLVEKGGISRLEYFKSLVDRLSKASRKY